MSGVTNILTKIRKLATQTALPQIILYASAKICFALMQMPHEKKQSTYIPFLITNLVLLSLAIGLKIFRHKFALIRDILKIQFNCFLLWIISSIMMIFSWSLLDNFEWGIFQRLLTMISEIMSLFMLTLLTKEDYMSKMEFIAYEVILALQILAVSFKTVGFIKYNVQSPHKDIVLLNLTTQIALMIILMDFLQKSYQKWKKNQIQDNVSRFQNQMVMANKPNNQTTKQVNLRQTL